MIHNLDVLRSLVIFTAYTECLSPDIRLASERSGTHTHTHNEVRGATLKEYNTRHKGKLKRVESIWHVDSLSGRKLFHILSLILQRFYTLFVHTHIYGYTLQEFTNYITKCLISR